MLNKSAQFLSSTTVGASSPSPPPLNVDRAVGSHGLGQQLYVHLRSYFSRPGVTIFDKICEVNRLVLPSVQQHLSSGYPVGPAAKSNVPAYTARDLDPVFVLLLQEVFGSAQVRGSGADTRHQFSLQASYHTGWSICALTRNKHYRDYNAALSLLGAGGAMLHLIDFLSHDPSCVYEFPVAKVPSRQQRQQLLSPQQQQQHNVSRNRDGEAVLILSPFEFYLYHYVCLVNQQSHLEWNPTGLIAENDSLYPSLLEEYLGLYLQMGGANFKSYDLDHQYHQPSAMTSPQVASPAAPSTTRHSLLRSDLVFAQHQSTSPVASSASIHRPASAFASSESWKSNVFVEAVTRFWVTSFSVAASPGGMQSVAGDSPSPTIPSSDVVKLVRMFIKHVHFFFNSFHPNQYDLRDSVRRGTFGPFFAGLRGFFEQLFDHWPYDASFRLVLETWLSYIQPWRYRGGEEQGQFQPGHWDHFIVEHLDFYDSLLRKVLVRFMRLDLSCSMNAFILFRVCKVLSQDGLPEALRDAVTFGGGAAGSLMANVSNASFFSDNQQMQHDPQKGNMFDCQFASTVSGLVSRAVEAKKILLEQRRALTCKKKSTKAEENWLSSMLIYIVQMVNAEQESQSAEVEEVDKTLQHLDFCIDKLVAVFDLSVNVEELLAAFSSQSPGFGRSSPVGKKQHGGDDPEPLTPQMRWDIINRTSKYSPKYHGNPDEAPLRSDECHALARLLHRLSAAVNARFPALGERYHDDTFVGAALRQVLAPPATYTLLAKHSLARVEHRLPARVVLRPFASHKVLAYMVLCLFFAWLFGRRFTLKAFVFFIVLWFLRLIYTVVAEPRDHHHLN